MTTHAIEGELIIDETEWFSLTAGVGMCAEMLHEGMQSRISDVELDPSIITVN